MIAFIPKRKLDIVVDHEERNTQVKKEIRRRLLTCKFVNSLISSNSIRRFCKGDKGKKIFPSC